jgi:hypothetical protein
LTPTYFDKHFGVSAELTKLALLNNLSVALSSKGEILVLETKKEIKSKNLNYQIMQNHGSKNFTFSRLV